jgi:rod shape-determining protein MreC
VRPTGPFVAEGRAGSRLLCVRHVPATADVRVGDLVVTSGACGLLPEGLSVGRVVGVENADADPMWEIEVEPWLPAETPESVALLLLGSWR